jgi:glycosyltransferase involved in cell wall biosynthesis
MSKESGVRGAPTTGRKKRLAVVLWNGSLGGAETLSVALAEHMMLHGAEIKVVFVRQPWPLGERLEASAIPYASLNLARGRDVIRHPRRYAAAVAMAGADGALLLECGFMGASLRAGGYRGPIVAVEHGSLLGLERFSRLRRLFWRLDRACGAWADDAEVAVSDYMLETMRQHTHAGRHLRIYNGIDTARYTPVTAPVDDMRETMVVGFAGRLISGKGADLLIRAVAQVNERVPVKLLIAGEGRERVPLASLAHSLGVDSQIHFLGAVNDMPAFWQGCDVAAIPSDTFLESFSMVTLEAMASGNAIVASTIGAIPELVLDGVTGTLVAPGSVGSLAAALFAYSDRPELRRAHGAAARTRAIEHFSIRDCALAYLSLFDALANSRSARASP